MYIDRGNILLKSSANVSFESYFPFIKFTYISGFIFSYNNGRRRGEGEQTKPYLRSIFPEPMQSPALIKCL